MLREGVYMKNGGLVVDVALHIRSTRVFHGFPAKKVVGFFQFVVTVGDGQQFFIA